MRSLFDRLAGEIGGLWQEMWRGSDENLLPLLRPVPPYVPPFAFGALTTIGIAFGIVCLCGMAIAGLGIFFLALLGLYLLMTEVLGISVELKPVG
jgi:hypothetical protein